MGEDPIEAVKREVKEETGFGFIPSHILGAYSLFEKHLKKEFNVTPHHITIIFTGSITIGKVEGLHEDVSEIKWFFPKEIDKMDTNILREIHIKKMVKDYLGGKRYPLDFLTHTISE